MKRQLNNLNPKMIRRYLHDKIDWNARLVSILGARGVGKTTLLLQHIQETGDVEHSLFVFADNIYFTTHTLLDLAGAFYRNGGKYLYIDEIHKYPNWSTEIKNIYDSYPTLKVVYRALIMSRDSSICSYQRRENPVKVVSDFPSLKEKMIIYRIGR